jgi:uncharacterized membrane protein YeiH
MSRELYATPVLIGCTALVLAKPFTTRHAALVVVVVGLIFALRASAIHWHINMPAWLTSDQDPR